MTTVLAHLTIKEGKEGQFEEISRGVYSETHANEPKMKRYEYFRGTEPRTYYVLLSFKDFNAFMTHQVADYHHNIGPGLNECVESIRLEYLDPINGAAPLTSCETHGRMMPDASDLWNDYVDRHSETTPSWWTTRRNS